MKRPLERACVNLKVKHGSVSRNHQGEVNSNIQVNGDSDMAPTCWLSRNKALKRTAASASSSV